MAHSPDESGAVLALGVMERPRLVYQGMGAWFDLRFIGPAGDRSGIGVSTLDGAELSP